MPGWRAPHLDGDHPEALSLSSVHILLFGWDKAPIAPPGEPGRWQLAFLSDPQIAALYQQHRPWLLEEAQRRGLKVPWAERAYRRC